MQHPAFVQYLDPGTGSMILQYLAALILTLLLTLKMYFKQIKEKIKKLVKEE